MWGLEELCAQLSLRLSQVGRDNVAQHHTVCDMVYHSMD